MPTIAEAKAKFPDFEGLDDNQVVDALHEAFYSDIPRDELAKKFGVKPQEAPAPKSGALRRYLADPAISLLQGAVGVPQAVVGMADLATGGRVGKALENQGGAVGFRPDEAQQILGEYLSPEQQAANKAVQDASQGAPGDDQGMMSKIGRVGMAAVRNPSVIAHSVLQSLPAMGAGGVVGRGALAVAPRMGAIATGLGEGVVTMGQQAEQIRTDPSNVGRVLTPDQAALAAGSGMLTGAIGAFSNVLAKKLGFETAENLLTGIKANPGAARGVVKQVLGGAVTEGFLEELPQSVQEQVAQNMALGKPLDEGVDQAAVLGALSGAVMGGAAQSMRGSGNGEGNMRMRGAAAASGGTAVLPAVPRRLHGELAAIASSDTGAGEEAKLQVLRARVLEAGADPAQVMRDLWGDGLADAPPRLRAALGRALDVSGLSFGSSPDGTPLKSAGDVIREDLQPEVGPATKAVNAGIETAARQVDAAMPPPEQQAPQTPRQANADMIAAIRKLDPELQDQALHLHALGNRMDVAPGVRRHAQNRLDAMLGDLQPLNEPKKDEKTGKPIVEEPVVAEPQPGNETDIALAQMEAEQRRFEKRKKPTGAPQEGDILNGRGEPFRTIGAAMSARQKAGEFTHELVRVADGLVVRPIPGAQEGGNGGLVQDANVGADQGAAPAPAPAPGGSERSGRAQIQPADVGGAPGGAPAAEPARKPGPANAVPALTTPAQPTTLGKTVEAQPAGTRSTTAADLVKAANEAAPSPQNDLPAPSEAQRNAGNFKMGHGRVGNLDVTLEYPAGSERVGKNKDGTEWSRRMHAHYGYIKRTEGADGDHLDVYVGPAPDTATHAYVIDQVKADGSFDETKTMLGYASQAAAVRAYRQHYPKDFKVGPVTAMPIADFEAWARSDASKGPAAQVPANVANRLTPPATQPQGEGNATQEVDQQAGVQPERQSGDQGGQAAEAGGGDRVQRQDGGGQEAPVEPIVEHTVGKSGKVLRGVVRNISLQEAKAIDPFTFKKDGGYFLREARVATSRPAPEVSAQRTGPRVMVNRLGTDGLTDAERAAGKEPYNQTPEDRAATERAAAAVKAEARQSQRTVERDAFRDLTNDPANVGKTIPEIAAILRERNVAEGRAGILARAIHKQVAKNAAELEKQKHRHPDVRAAAIAEAVTRIFQNAEDATPDRHGAVIAGFDHALAGKIKSSLVGDNLPDRLQGFEAAQKWVKTEEGKAWYEGRPVNKLQNTGVDLRRWYEQMQANMKAGESDMKKAWAGIERATARADLFAPLLPDGVTPGMRVYVEEVRKNTKTFRDWLDQRDWTGRESWRGRRRYGENKSNVDYMLDGSRYPRELSIEDRQRFQDDEAYRIQYLQDLAGQYTKAVRGFIDFAEGVSSVKEAAQRFEDRYVNAEKMARLKERGFRRFDEATNEAGKRVIGSLWVGHQFDFFKMRASSDWAEALISKEATIALPDKTRQLVPPRLDRVIRDAPSVRKGDVTPQQFKDTFGLADVGFGKWVGAKQDQDHLNYAYDALTDLAKHFGTDPKNLGFGGQLHLTIGALGHGKFAAHFAPAQPGPTGTVQVINLTNTRGDGTVYHEWTHALDHNLGGEWRNKVRPRLLNFLKNGVMTKEGVEKRAEQFLIGGWFFKGNKREDKVETAIYAMRISPKQGQSAYKKNADQLGADYWGNDEELIARASEAWAADTLGHTNNYLVNAAWVGDAAVTKDKGYRGTPYPSGEERRMFNMAYTALAKAVKWEDGRPVVKLADFNAALPAEFLAGEKRRAELMERGAMEALRDDLTAVLTEAKNAKEQAARDKAQREQDELDALAEKAIADLPIVDAPPPSDTNGQLTTADLAAIFDQASAELSEETAEQPAEAPAPAPQETARQRIDRLKAARAAAGHKDTLTAADLDVEASAGKLLGEAAKLGVKGADEALRGLAALFGASKGGRLNSFGAGFDEETYRAAKPHFKAALEAFQAAGKSLKDLFKLLIQQFGDGIKDYAIRFAQDEGLSAQLGSKPSASAQLAQWVQSRLSVGHTFDWKLLFQKADEAFGGTQAEGKYTPKDAYDAAEAGMNGYIMAHPDAYSPQASPEQAMLAVMSLTRRTDMLPTQTKRTAEQDEFQQFSTVPAFGFIANWVANVSSADTMLEPSAGIGGLAVFAKNAGAKLILNELSSRRAAVLQEVFPSAQVFHENAEQLDNVLPADLKPTVVVMNPPFSASAGRMQGQRSTSLGALHVEQALERLAPGGRLVAVVGEGMTMDKPTFKAWWAKIGKQYDIRAVIQVDGKGYAKYGTTFNNALLVIDKQPPSGRPVITTPAGDYTSLVGLLTGVRDERNQSNLPVPDREGVERDAAESERQQALRDEQGIARPDSPDAGRTGPVGGEEPASGAGVGRGGRGRSGNGRGGRPGSTVREPGAGPDGGRADTAGGGTSDGANAARPDTGGQPTGVSVTAAAATSAALTDSIFEAYRPQRLEVAGAKPHPGPLVQSAAMASVLPPAPTYTPNLPKETITEGKLSLAQIEAVVYAGQAHGETLSNGDRRGYFIGDGTGVGKGREISGILLDNMRQGRKLHVWISEKQGLMVDAKRDFSGVGGDDSIIFNQNKTKAEDAIDEKTGILFTTYSTLRSGAQSQATGTALKPVALAKAFPAGARVRTTNGKDYVLAEDAFAKLVKEDRVWLETSEGRRGYVPSSMVESIDGITEWRSGRPAGDKKTGGQSRLDQLIKALGESFDGVIVFDEAHNAGNAVAIKGERGVSEPSAQAMAVVELQKRLPQARVVYVSATGATQVSNLSYATRLGLWGEGTPFPAVQNFIDEMTKGGLATMELVARDMKQMGAYIARSLSFDGVTYSRVEHTLSPLQRDIYDRLADGWQVTLQNFIEALKITGAIDADSGKTKNGRALAAAKSAYWGAQQRFFNQIITAMQMPTLIDQVEKDLAAGEAVVMQLVNTNEAQQERALAKRKEEGETELEDLDLTPRDQLIQMVEKSFPVVQFEEFTDTDGTTKSRPVLDAAGNPVQSKKAVALRDKLLADLKEIRVPDGPLEIIMNHFGPDRVAEVTGRTQRVVRKPDPDGNIKAQLETRGSTAARADAESFLADKKPILVFSDAGGTGFSFHADLTKANQRKRKHYLIQPGWRADKAVQGFGRTHRTNQKSAPHYGLVSTDIPAQKRFLSSIARRLDQLGALTKGQRDTANQGLFSEKDNLESKYATQAVRQLLDDSKAGQVAGLEFRDFLRQMGLEDIVDPTTGQIADHKYPPTRQFLNRMLSLRLDMQSVVFDAFIQRMEEKVELAAARGMLDTGMQTIRALETKVLRDETVHIDKRTSAETRYVELELTLPNRFFSAPTQGPKDPPLDWRVNEKTGKVWAAFKSGTETTQAGNVVLRYRMQGTSGTTIKTEEDLKKPGAYRSVTDAEARALWSRENEARPQTITSTTHMITGAILPIWDRIASEGAIQVARTQTADGKRLLGRLIPNKEIGETLKRLDVSSAESKLPPATVLARLLKGEIGELANGWKLERVRVSDDLRVELKAGYVSGALATELTKAGLLHERISWNDRYFVPTGAEGAAVLGKILENRPLIKLAKPGAAEDETPAFSRGTGAASRATEIQAVADRIAERWTNAPQIVVASSMADERIPAAVRATDAQQRSQGATGEPEGFYHGGTVYLVADQMGAADVPRVLLHESLGHYGLRGTYGREIGTILDRLATLNAGKVRAKAKQYGLDFDKPSERRQAAEEVLAEMAQTRPELGWVQRAIAAIRAWLREHIPGYKSMMLSDDEIIRSYLLPARRFVEGGRTTIMQRAAPASVIPEQVPMFSRSFSGMLSDASEIALPAGYLVGDLFNSSGKLSWWHKSVGTMFNLAQRYPAFKRVYDATQNFLNDVSRYANEQGDLAPTLLPKLDGWRDIGKSPISAENTKAIAKPIFEGTLSWARDESGKPVRLEASRAAADAMSSEEKAQALFRAGKVSEAELKRWQATPLDIFEGAVRNRYEAEYLKAGVVWTDAELRSIFGATPEQIGLYHEFRNATDRSLTDLATSEMLRLGGQDVPAGLRAHILTLHDHDAAAMALRDHFYELAENEPARAKIHDATADKIVLLADKTTNLQKQGYAPLSRFGQFTLDVVTPDGERAYFGLFETARERARMSRQMRANFSDARITEGTVSQEAYKVFAGVSPETIELFGELLGLDATGDQAKDLAFQQAIKLTQSTRSSMRRLIHRKGIAGFSEDAGRVLAGFVVSNARRTSVNLHMGEVDRAVTEIPQPEGQLKDAAERLREYVKNPREEAHWIRGLLFAQYLGGSVASGLINATQPFTITLPWLSQFGGISAAGKQMAAAVVDQGKKKTGDKALDAALKDAEELGIVSPQEIHQMMAQAQGSGHLISGDGTAAGNAAAKARNVFSKLTLAWGKVFSVAEQFNRRTTFIAAYRTAVARPELGDPAAFAARAVAETQFTYNKGSRPEWARGAIGATLFTFKSFSINYLELLHRMWTTGGPQGKKAVLLAVAILFLVGGADGVPFAEDVDDAIDGLLQHLGYNFASKRARRDFFASIFGDEVGRFMSKGMSGLPGVPIDVSGRMGMGNLLPGTGLLKKKSDHTADVAEFLGPVGDLGKRAGQAVGQLLNADVGGALKTLQASATRNIIQGFDMLSTGMYRDTKGRKVVDTTVAEAVFKMLGFQPSAVAHVQDASGEVVQMVQLAKLVQSELTGKLAKSMFDNDRDARAEVMAARDRWNENNPEMRVRLDVAGALRRLKEMRQSKAERIAKTTPKAIRERVRQELQAAQ